MAISKRDSGGRRPRAEKCGRKNSRRSGRQDSSCRSGKRRATPPARSHGSAGGRYLRGGRRPRQCRSAPLLPSATPPCSFSFGILKRMQTIVGVLRGGPSREHEVSLRSGAAKLANLPEERYTARDIYIDRKGQWHDRGRPTAPERVLRQIDVALIGLHGEYGEDGEVQKLLEKFGVPYSGADSFGSYLAMHKIMAKTRAREAGLLTPEFRYIENRESIAEAAK